MKTQLKSKILASCDYDEESGVLVVQMVRGSEKRFFNVPKSVALDLAAATSPGEFYNKNIRGKFAEDDEAPVRKRSGSSFVTGLFSGLAAGLVVAFALWAVSPGSSSVSSAPAAIDDRLKDLAETGCDKAAITLIQASTMMQIVRAAQIPTTLQAPLAYCRQKSLLNPMTKRMLQDHNLFDIIPAT